MGVATYYTDFQLIDDAESTTDWDGYGSLTMAAVGSDAVACGNNAIEVAVRAAGTYGSKYDMTTPVNFAVEGRRLYLWLWIGTSDVLDIADNGGVHVYAEDSSNNWGYYYIGGSDTGWVGQGYKRVCIDLNRTPDANGGTDPDVTVIQFVGAGVVALAGLGKGILLQIDHLHYGTEVGIYGGTQADPLTFEDIITGDVDNCYGLVDKNKANAYELASHLIIGDTGGAANTWFSSTNEIVVWADNPLTGGDNILSLAENNGETHFLFGNSDPTGGGEAEVGFDGTVMYSANDIFGLGYGLDLTSGVTELKIFGSTFQGADDSIRMSSDTTHRFKSNSVVDCGIFKANQAEIRNCFFNRTADTNFSGSALEWNDSINIQDSSFLANTDTTNNPHGILHLETGEATYDNLSFAGNDFDVHLAVGGDLVISLLNGSNPSSFDAFSGTISAELAVSLDVHCEDQAGSPATGVRVALTAVTGGTQLMNELTDEFGDATQPYTFTGNQQITIRARKGSGVGTNFFPFLGGGTVDSNGFSTSIIMIEDTINSS
jgi:hypothetical protein